MFKFKVYCNYFFSNSYLNYSPVKSVTKNTFWFDFEPQPKKLLPLNIIYLVTFKQLFVINLKMVGNLYVMMKTYLQI